MQNKDARFGLIKFYLCCTSKGVDITVYASAMVTSTSTPGSMLIDV